MCDQLMMETLSG